MKETLDSFIHDYENDLTVRKYKLTREEFVYLYLIAQGCNHFELMDYLDCQNGKLYRLRKNIIRKMKAKNLNHALVIYAKLGL